jgi:hypothetical protein
MTVAQWQASGKGAGSIVADPKFVDPEHGDFHLKPDSPAGKIGFVPFDYSKAGVYGDPAWLKLAGSVEYPPVEFAPDPPPAPPLAVRDNFETPRGREAVLDAKVFVEGKGDSLRVSGDTAAEGQRSLKMVDAPGLTHPHQFNPHFYYSTNHTSGTSRVTVDLRMDPGAVLFYEWRDDARPYHVGPSLWLEGGRLRAAGKTVIEIPEGQWFRVEVTATLGEQSTGKWDLRVTLPNGKTEVFRGLPNRSAEFKRLDWVGFCATGDKKAVVYFDNIELTNTEPR